MKLPEKIVTCKRCNAQVLRHVSAKYCHKCSAETSEERRAATKAKSREKHRDEYRERYRASALKSGRNARESAVKAGRERSVTERLSFPAPSTQDHDWIVRFQVPFTYAASKNHIYGLGHHIYKRQASKKLQDDIMIVAKQALRGHTVHHNKVWIGLLVEKPDHRGDAINVVDLVCDALKHAVGVDDRWFSLNFVDWRINKNDPKLMIQIGQSDCFDAQSCSACGHILPLDAFNHKKGTMHGRERTCRECRRLGRLMRQAERAGE